MSPGPASGESVTAALTQARADEADLRREFAQLADPDEVAIDDEHDSEGSTIGFERARIAGLLARTERRIADLEAAAARVESGSYQSCAGCHGEIGAERLEALPATRFCVACARRSVGSPRG